MTLTRHPLILLLIATLIALAADAVRADTFTVRWTAPVTRADGTPLPAAELAGYRIEWTLAGVEQPGVTTGNVTSYVVQTASYGRGCFTVFAVDVDGLESDPSNTVCRRVRPSKPGGVVVR